jgi:thiol-disulfide isomerase/thioredoxin
VSAGALAWKDQADVMRRGLLLLAMVVGISLVLWSGWHNLRARRRAMQMQEQSRLDLLPGAAGPAAGGSGAGTSTEQMAGASPLKGKMAPGFTLDDLDGKKVSLSDYKGRPLVVNFWATWCGPCRVEMPWFEEFQKKYAGSGFEVLGVTYDVEAGKPTIEKNVKQIGVTYPILLSTPKVEDAYLHDSEVLPMSFYVDKAGNVVDVTAGLGPKDEMEGMVKETIAAGAK